MKKIIEKKNEKQIKIQKKNTQTEPVFNHNSQFVGNPF